MNSSDIINFFSGNVEFEVESPDPEKILTVCMEKNVDIWAVRRIDGCTMRFCCRLPDEKGIGKICRENGAVSVSKIETGFPFRAKNKTKRWGFLVGIIIFFVIIILMSNVIWRIDIVGYGDKTQLIAVERFLKENGLSVGAIRGLLDEQTLRRNLMRNFDGIAGATVNFFGSVALVELEQAVPKPEIEMTTPANIVAEEDAQIVEISVFNGTQLVKKDATVRKGQLLVGGVCDSKRIGFRLVHARAEIKARVNRKIDVFVPFEQEEKVETGEEKNVYSLTLFGKTVFLNSCDYGEFHSSSATRDLRLSENIILPISLTKTHFAQTETVKTSLTEEQAFKKAIDILDAAEARGMKNLEIEEKRIETKHTSEGVYVAYRYSVIVPFGRELEIKNSELAEERE